MRPIKTISLLWFILSLTIWRDVIMVVVVAVVVNNYSTVMILVVIVVDVFVLSSSLSDGTVASVRSLLLLVPDFCSNE